MSAVTSRAAAVPDFPARPIRLICPFAPGGGNDIFSRSIGAAISKSVGQQVVVDNRPGANTIIAMQLVANAEPDGYTLVMASSTLSINATLYPKLPYDSVKSFAPVSLAVSTPLVVAVNASSPMKTIADLIAAAKAKPGQIMYPSAGIGNSTHLAGELLAAMARIDLNHVPYKGSLPGITEVIAGRLHVVFPTLPSAKPHLNSGRLRALAVTSSKRASSLPDVPTVAESELAGYEVSTWYGVLATGGTPRRIVMALHSEIVKALVTPEVRKAADAQGLEVVGNTPEQFAAYVQAEIGKWAKVIKTAGVKVE
ncbi:MAG: hypothetical protein A3F74_06860 [Betaproteobacteria bacterium RIFCSPLOWO2_12_FULL_62_58]|nr:MAG: hypothetical protein A3F74_06860 [Betaproteobacteria bacterium RIFCSPLOWO2_12_FULL_62_58]